MPSSRHALALLPLSLIAVFVLFANPLQFRSHAGDPEFMGSLDGELIPNTSDLDQIIFRPVKDLSKIKLTVALPSDANVTAVALSTPAHKSAILTLLVQPEDEPFLYIV